MKVAIWDDTVNMLVAGFDEEHMIVQLTNERELALTFDKAIDAHEWGNIMSGRGYGLKSWRLVDITTRLIDITTRGGI